MEVTEHTLLEIREASGAGHARRTAADLAQRLGFSAAEIGRLGIVVTETATNLVKHGGGGELLLRTLASNGTRGIQERAMILRKNYSKGKMIFYMIHGIYKCNNTI